jgi:hypothetical protein
MTVIGSFAIITVMLILLWVLPIWPWSRSWGWRASKILAVILLALLVLLFNNRI